MNATLINSYCVSMLCDHCISTCMSYLFLCVFYSANCKGCIRGNFSQRIHAWYIAEELFCSKMNISLPMWRAVIGLFISCNIAKCLISGFRCYSISNLKFVLFFALFLSCHENRESNPGPKVWQLPTLEILSLEPQ